MEKKRLSHFFLSATCHYHCIIIWFGRTQLFHVSWQQPEVTLISTAQSRLDWKHVVSVGLIGLWSYFPNDQYNLDRTSIIYGSWPSSFRGQFLIFSRRAGCCLKYYVLQRDTDRRQSLKLIPKVVFVIFLLTSPFLPDSWKSEISSQL